MDSRIHRTPPLPKRWGLIAPDDRGASTIQLRVKVDSKGGLKVLGHRSLPKLKEDAIIELRISTYSLLRESDVDEWLKETQVQLFPKGEELRVRISAKDVPEGLSQHVIEEPLISGPSHTVVAVALRAPLTMTTRPSGYAALDPVKCYVPSLKSSAESLNEAYTVVSSAFEPKRRSHTGNVFQTIFYLDEGWWVPLDAYRTWILLGNEPLRPTQGDLFPDKREA